MEENKIPTAVEFLEFFDDYTRSILIDIGEEENVTKAMIEFAKMHVKKALDTVIENKPYLINDMAIEECYPPEIIK